MVGARLIDMVRFNGLKLYYKIRLYVFGHEPQLIRPEHFCRSQDWITGLSKEWLIPITAPQAALTRTSYNIASFRTRGDDPDHH